MELSSYPTFLRIVTPGISIKIESSVPQLLGCLQCSHTVINIKQVIESFYMAVLEYCIPLRLFWLHCRYQDFIESHDSQGCRYCTQLHIWSHPSPVYCVETKRCQKVKILEHGSVINKTLHNEVIVLKLCQTIWPAICMCSSSQNYTFRLKGNNSHKLLIFSAGTEQQELVTRTQSRKIGYKN